MRGIQQFDLTGRTAIVTGGSKGLGAAIAAGLASAGARVMVTSRHADEAMSVAASLEQQFGQPMIGFQADVANPAEVQAMVEQAVTAWTKVDILVNNAGINIRGPLTDLSLEQFEEVIRTNVTGVWLMCRTVVPHMPTDGKGRIINLASTLGLVGLGNRTPYAASKGGVVQLTRTLALELAPRKILCNAICPGPFLTPMNESIADHPDTKKFILGAVPLDRWGRLEEIQGAAIFLASDAASYMTGSLVVVDGGWTAH